VKGEGRGKAYPPEPRPNVKGDGSRMKKEERIEEKPGLSLYYEWKGRLKKKTHAENKVTVLSRGGRRPEMQGPRKGKRDKKTTRRRKRRGSGGKTQNGGGAETFRPGGTTGELVRESLL